MGTSSCVVRLGGGDHGDGAEVVFVDGETEPFVEGSGRVVVLDAEADPRDPVALSVGEDRGQQPVGDASTAVAAVDGDDDFRDALGDVAVTAAELGESADPDGAS